MTTPKEIFDNAIALPETSQAEIRAKISRLYYALFSHACEFENQLPSTGNTLKKASGCHSQLTQRLTNPTLNVEEIASSSRNLGTKQMLAHEIRVKADYHLDKPITTNELKNCKRFVTDGLAIQFISTNIAVLPPTASSRPNLQRIK